MLEYYLKVVRDNYANFEGRARRSEYWYFLLFNFLIYIALFILFGVFSAMDMPEIGMIFMIVYFLYALAMFIPGIAVAVRRLHDTGNSGWMYFVVLIPFIGGIWLLVLMATEGNMGENTYGPDPKLQN
ncbi:DUF805 domain-containing protein [Aquimarina brevivitae]|uniref:Uncharacterized membrane protein YhaH (DUF805 family) n=1 Tax=Aquimarina brevivitae TaxID=323412 RepID=A0A4V2F795_9FLAO|nr:DUF805 domain-containing protein [Aquimarina brevivitae]RZS99039.1 uncharacterized membrane protein YhaH (DUF805 family) [Aquimarina brevivitae]